MTSPLTPERLAAIRAHHTTVTDYAPAPWRWAGSVEAYRPIYYLATEHHGRKWVMGASKAGFSGAELNFPVVSPETGWGLLAKGRELAVREQPYRDQIGDIDNPFAEYLKRAPEYVGELLADHARLTAEVARLTALITAPDGGGIPLPLLDEPQACQVVTCDEPATGWGVCGEHLSHNDPELPTGCGCGDFAHGIVSSTCPAHGIAVPR